MDIRIELAGTSPLLMRNGDLVDPDNPFTREIATYTAKRKKTDDDRHAIERLEWFGALYTDNGQIVMPTANIRKSLINAGKISKQGLQVARSVAFHDLHVPFAYDGSDDIDILHKDAAFSNRTPVGIGAKRTMRVRPQFIKWAVVADALLLEDVMNLEDLERIGARAGLAEGLGDNRVNGYGRFTMRTRVL
jgi:hypothetical protein